MFEALNDINWALFAPLIGLDILLKIIGIIAWIRQRNEGTTSLLWLIVILAINFFGPIIYFTFGRREVH